MSILGNRVVRREDPRFLTVGGTYVEDVHLDGALHATFVRSPVAHARITGVDVEEARSMPGVVAVFTSADIDLPPVPPAPGLPKGFPQPWLAADRVRYVGEPVVAVLTEERYQGPDAAEAVVVDYDPLPPVVGVEAALDGGVVIHPDAATNVAFEIPPRSQDPDLFADCDVVVRHRFVNQRVAPVPLEVRSSASVWGDDGRLTHWASCQGGHLVRDFLARVHRLEKDQVRVIVPDVGGGFGAKGFPHDEELLVAWLARTAGRPVRWTETRSDSMVGLVHGRGQVQDIELGGTRDGDLRAYRLSVIQDAGAYPAMGTLLPNMTRMMATGVYDIPKLEFQARSVFTTTTPVGAYRGAGRPEAAAAIERAVDLFAAEAGLDPAEVRRRNAIAADAFPHKTAARTEYDSGNYRGAIALLLDAAGYDQLRDEQRRRREAGARHLLGIGLSLYVEVTNPAGAGEFGAVAVQPDGRAVVRTGTTPYGQGHVTAWTMLVAEQLGLPLEAITVVHGDTDVIPRGAITGGSRSLQASGSAVQQAATEVAERARRLAAELLEANPDDVVLDKVEGRFHVAGTPAVSRSWAEVAAAAGGDGKGDGGGGLSVEVDSEPGGPTFPFGAHLAVVEVDADTGKAVLKRMVAVDDAGRVLNPLLVEGQVHGGLAQGAAQALFEEVRFDEEGNPLTATLVDYMIPSAADLPGFETLHQETLTDRNPLGAKGIGESGTIGATPAVQNAVVDALAHLGVRHLDMPTTPERIWRALREAAGTPA